MMNSAISSFQEAFDIKGEVGRLVDIATSETLLGADLQQNLQICDKVNAGGKEAAKDAVRTLRKRVKHKSAKVQLLAISVLEALVKNCGPDLLTQVATRDVMGDLQSVVLQSNAEPGLQRKTLQLIQAWGEAFKDGRDEYPLFHETYSALKAQGVRFPEYDPTLAPNVVRTQGMGGVTGGAQRAASGHAPPAAPPPRQQAPPGPAKFDSEKLLADLEEVKMQTGLLTDMLGEVNSRVEDVGENDLIRQLIRNCKIYQPRIMTLVGQITQDDLIPHLLAVNDDLIRVLERHDEKLQEFRNARGGGGSGAGSRPRGGLGATPMSAPVAARPAAAHDEAADLLGGAGAHGDELDDLLGSAAVNEPLPPPARAVDSAAEVDMGLGGLGAPQPPAGGAAAAADEPVADELDLLGLGGETAPQAEETAPQAEPAAPPIPAPLAPPPKAGAAKKPEEVKDLLDFD